MNTSTKDTELSFYQTLWHNRRWNDQDRRTLGDFLERLTGDPNELLYFRIPSGTYVKVMHNDNVVAIVNRGYIELSQKYNSVEDYADLGTWHPESSNGYWFLDLSTRDERDGWDTSQPKSPGVCGTCHYELLATGECEWCD